MTNIIQYLDICADTLKRLAGAGLTPSQMKIEVDEAVLKDLMIRIHGNGGYLIDRYVNENFEGEIINRGYIKVSRSDFIFHICLKVPEEPDYYFGHRRIPKNYLNF